jgi:hypothetical protein
VALASAPGAVAQTSTPTRTNTPAVTATPTATGTAVSATATRTPTAAAGAPTTAAQCMNGGWRNFTNPTFKNQGDCVSFVASQGRAKGNPEYTRTPTPSP